MVFGKAAITIISEYAAKKNTGYAAAVFSSPRTKTNIVAANEQDGNINTTGLGGKTARSKICFAFFTPVSRLSPLQAA